MKWFGLVLVAIMVAVTAVVVHVLKVLKEPQKHDTLTEEDHDRWVQAMNSPGWDS